MAKRPGERFLYEVLPVVVGVGVLVALVTKSKPVLATDEAPAALPPERTPLPSLSMHDPALGRVVGDGQQGVVYRIVANPTGLPQDVTLRIDAYPTQRSLEGKTFLLGSTIAKYGMNHPAVAQVVEILAA